MTLLLEAHHDREPSSGAAARPSTKSVGLNYQRFCPGEAWTPSINLYEDAENYFLVMDLAGVKPKAIDIRVDDRGTLVILGNREAPEVPTRLGPTKLHLMEIDHGRFCRSMDLPEDADVDRIEASYRGGFLWVQISRKA
jgi:HSP20 family protein